MDAIIDKSGSTVSTEIHGYIDCSVKLTGMPDLTMSFVNPRLFDDVSFHPCVRYKKWESDRILSFVPPDGNFRLVSYHIGSGSVVSEDKCCILCASVILLCAGSNPSLCEALPLLAGRHPGKI